jgi:RecA/RadA recombinase
MKSQLYTEIIRDKALMTVCSQNTAPLVAAGKKMRIGFSKIEKERLATGFQQLDKNLGGGINQRGITQVLGPVKAGKTTFVHHLIRQVLEVTKGVNVLYITPVDDCKVLLRRVGNCLTSLIRRISSTELKRTAS